MAIVRHEFFFFLQLMMKRKKKNSVFFFSFLSSATHKEIKMFTDNQGRLANINLLFF
jgi:hypothetical protein